MRGKAARGGATPKSPRLSLTINPGPMNKYVTQAGNAEKQAMEKQQTTKSSQMARKEKEKKKAQNKITQEADTLSESRTEQEPDKGMINCGKINLPYRLKTKLNLCSLPWKNH